MDGPDLNNFFSFVSDWSQDGDSTVNVPPGPSSHRGSIVRIINRSTIVVVAVFYGTAVAGGRGVAEPR